ncbi:uncharacterized protein LOC123689392 [Pieris rapae]|uniref:uncharacterized protein LOC123689392 n=1 Tax=Pieris rapae TaxID=64459 RepID=UPI001E280846|nr:uncharacterized protein LOC123689392 [Pieris rapae]
MTLYWEMLLQIVLITILDEGTAYYRDWGPILPPFTPGVVPIQTECDESGRPCLELPTKKICKEKFTQPHFPWLPLPWWFFYCQSLIAPKSRRNVITTSSTIHPYFAKTLEEFLRYQRQRKRFSKK